MPAVLRVHPHRGDTVAAGVVVLTLFTLLTLGRLGAEWSDGVRFVFVLVITAGVVALALGSDAAEGDVPRPYESVNYVASFLLVLLTLAQLADLLGATGESSGTFVWVGLLVFAYCAYLATRRNSAIMTLFAALTGVVVVVAFIDWVFNPDSVTTFRWILFLCALVLTLLAVQRRDAARRHAVSLVDAVGFVMLAVGVTLAADLLVNAVGLGLFGGDADVPQGGPFGWELVLLVFGFGLIAYGCVDRERVPPFLGIGVLGFFFFLTVIPGEDGPSLIGWPIVLLILAAALLAIGLRPRQDLPPEPPVPTAGPTTPPPTAPTVVAEP
jgi:MFS family permease